MEILKGICTLLFVISLGRSVYWYYKEDKEKSDRELLWAILFAIVIK